MQNLRIEALLESPVVLYDPLHFDALLAMAWFAQHGSFEAPSKPEEIEQPDSLPIGYSGELPRCSAGFVVGKPTKGVWHKRFCTENEDMIAFGNHKEALRTTLGPFKDYSMPIMYIPTQKVVWFAHGDAEAIMELLEYIPALGKKRSIGYGAVSSWELHTKEGDSSIFVPGGVARVVPVGVDENAQVVRRAGYSYPYWDRTKFAECSIPKWRFDSVDGFEEHTGESYHVL